MIPTVFVPLTHYCERGIDPALTAEPVNALSNLAFFLAAAWAYARLRRRARGADTRAEHLLIGLAILVGIGSTLFHTFATAPAMIADVAPIAAFVLAYAGLAGRRYLHLSWPVSAVAVAFLVAGEAAAHAVTCNGGPCLNGSAGYLPPLCFLIFVAASAKRSCPIAAPSLVAAAVVFALSLTLRTLDLALCETLAYLGKPRGTHALWHVLNAATLALLIDAAIKSAPAWRPSPVDNNQ